MVRAVCVGRRSSLGRFLGQSGMDTPICCGSLLSYAAQATIPCIVSNVVLLRIK